MARFNVDHAISAWRRSYRFNRTFSAEDLDELEEHLRDGIDSRIEAGEDAETAFRAVTAQLGARRAMEQEYRKVRWVRPKRRQTLLHALTWHVIMFRNYIKVTLRTLRREKGYAFINVVGLAVGLAVCLLLVLFVKDEWSYNQFHAEVDHLYRVHDVKADESGAIGISGEERLPLMLGPTLSDEFPQVVASARMNWERPLLRVAGQEAIGADILYTDPDFLTMFSFPLLEGNVRTALSDPLGLVLSASVAQRMFGAQSPVGQQVEVRIDEVYHPFTVMGVIADPPANSTIQYEVLLPFERHLTLNTHFRGSENHWNYAAVQVYVQLQPEVDMPTLNKGLDALYERLRPWVSEERAERAAAEAASDTLAVQSQTRVAAADYIPASFRLRGLQELYLTEVSNPRYSYTLLGIALGILAIACINFMTLSIAQSAQRALEVGIRKAVGAQRRQLMTQFWGEAYVLASIALVVGLGLMVLLLPGFNALAGKTYTLADAFDLEVVGILVLLLLVTGLVAGSYPALLLSGFQPIETIGRRLKLGGTNVLTQSLVVVQFALSVFLIISTLVMQQQMQHTRTMDLGFNRDHVLQINTEGMDGRRMVKRLQQQLSNEPRIAGVTAAGVSMGWSGSIDTRYTHGDHQYTLNIFTVEANYFDVFDIAFAQGRPFDPSTSADSSYVIVNQAALDDYRQKNGGLEEPLGTVLPGMDGMGIGQLIGVVEDFNYNVLYQDHAPAIFMLHSFFGVNYIYIRLLPGDVAGGLAAAESAWQAAIPDVPFRYRFLDEDMQQYYEDDQRWSNIVRYASLVAIFLACLGLLGLAALTAARRTKEVGIRKVLGASVPSLVGLVTREFLVMVVLGIIIAVPAGYIVMQQWLNDFVFRIELGPTLFVLGGVLALLLAGSVVSYQGFRAARTNPVDSLRYE